MADDEHMITSQQLKAARALLGWTQSVTADAVGLSHSTLRRLEAEPGPLQCTYETAVLIISGLGKHGIRFSVNGVSKEGEK